MADVTFLVCGQTIKVGDVDDFYNSFRHIFYQAASETSQIFAELYNSYGDIDTVVNKAFDDGLRIVIGVINRFAIKGFLIHQKIYDIDGS